MLCLKLHLPMAQALVAFATTAKDARGLAKATDKVLDDKRRKLLADMVAGAANGRAAAAPGPAASAAPSTAGSRWGPMRAQCCCRVLAALAHIV